MNTKPLYAFKVLPAINEVTATAEPAVGGSGAEADVVGSGAQASSANSTAGGHTAQTLAAVALEAPAQSQPLAAWNRMNRLIGGFGSCQANRWTLL